MSRSKQSHPGRLRSGQRSTKPADVSRFKFATPTDVALAQATRYSIQSDDSGHDYFVEVGMEGEFENWVQDEFYDEAETIGYEGHDYEANRIDGRFTFTDPRND